MAFYCKTVFDMTKVISYPEDLKDYEIVDLYYEPIMNQLIKYKENLEVARSEIPSLEN